ncbi:MAG: hypothetical protein FWB73_09610 [Treponema sp.]|nr:hypothetical protein [Treponema sp.]
MINKKIWLGMLAIVLVFGMIIISCNNDESEDGINELDELDYNTGNPSQAFLTKAGLNQTQYDQIVNAAGSGFKGWVFIVRDEYSEALMVWTGRNLSNFDSVANTLKNIFGDEQGRDSKEGRYYANGDGYSLNFHSIKMSEDGYYIPAGAMTLDFTD